MVTCVTRCVQMRIRVTVLIVCETDGARVGDAGDSAITAKCRAAVWECCTLSRSPCATGGSTRHRAGRARVEGVGRWKGLVEHRVSRDAGGETTAATGRTGRAAAGHL